jgi:hypothetical protein
MIFSIGGRGKQRGNKMKRVRGKKRVFTLLVKLRFETEFYFRSRQLG